MMARRNTSILYPFIAIAVVSIIAHGYHIHIKVSE